MKIILLALSIFLSSCVSFPQDPVPYHPEPNIPNEDVFISDYARQKYNKHLLKLIQGAKNSNLTKMCRSWRKAKEVWMISYQKEFVDSNYHSIVLVDLDKLGGLTEVAPHLPYLKENCN